MRFLSSEKVKLGIAFAFAKLFKRKSPLFLGWDLTYRCNFECKYCKIPRIEEVDELSTEQVCSGIEQLHQLGTKRIHFGGGEVLLRNDLGKILSLCKNKGISSVVLTNGVLFEEKLDDIKQADLVKLSFDGNEQVHDRFRGTGSFKKVLQAAELARKFNINVAFNATLHSYNINQIDFILGISSKLGLPVKFQVINEFLAGSQDITLIKLSEIQRKKVIAKLIKAKEKNRYIINSKPALQYMRDYPKVKRIPCSAGKIYARISADGYFYPCQMMRRHHSDFPYAKNNIKDTFKNLSSVDCAHCLCTTTLELNLIYSLNVRAILNGLEKF